MRLMNSGRDPETIAGFNRALCGYTVKEIFSTKLRGEPFKVLRKTLIRDIDNWLLERNIFEHAQSLSNDYNQTYRCLHPINIYYQNGRGMNTHYKCDSMKIGDIWTF